MSFWLSTSSEDEAASLADIRRAVIDSIRRRAFNRRPSRYRRDAVSSNSTSSVGQCAKARRSGHQGEDADGTAPLRLRTVVRVAGLPNLLTLPGSPLEAVIRPFGPLFDAS